MKLFTRFVSSALAWTALQDVPFGVPMVALWTTGLVVVPVAALVGAIVALATIVDPTWSPGANGGKEAVAAGFVILWVLLFPAVLQIARREELTRQPGEPKSFFVRCTLVAAAIFFAAVGLSWLVNAY